jgi:branched-chain amino acid transport system substrate-binding protein
VRAKGGALSGAAAAALAVGVATALAGSAATPGVTATTVLIGGTAPITGEASPAAAVAKGAAAYLQYASAKGIFGRTITYTYLDDGYDPARTVLDVKQLVEQDGVFAIFNTLGTNNNLAIRDYLNQQQVPQLFVASGASTWGTDYKKYPWTIGFIPSYVLEGQVYAHYVLKTRPKTKIGVLYQDDDYGRDLLAGLRRGLGAQTGRIVAQVGYDPTAADVSSQVAQIKAAGADTFMIFAFGKFAIQAFVAANKLGWHPQVFVNAVASSSAVMQIADLAGAKAVTRGAISIVFFKDPTDPRWKKDKGLALERRILEKYAPGSSPTDGYYVAGMASAYSLVDALRKAGKNLTRAGIMKAALSLNEKANPFVIPGIVVRTSATDHFPMQQVSLQRWTKGHWTSFGGIVAAKS